MTGARPAQASEIISASHIVRTYRHRGYATPALRGVDLNVRRGEFLAVTGPSGSGKSTLLHILGGLDRPDHGEIRLEDKLISRLSDRELSLVRRRRIGFLLQSFNLLPTLTVAENVAFQLLLDGVHDAIDRARKLLDSIGLGARGDRYPAHLSAGEQQRAALARALVTRPAVVFADEPTGNLDSKSGEQILRLLRETADGGQTIVMVTHSVAAATQADRRLNLVDGAFSSPLPQTIASRS